MRLGGVAAIAFATLLVSALPNVARAESSVDHERAVEEFNAARKLFEANDCKGAIPHFVRSLRFEQSVGARFNLAECSAREGKTAEAWNHFKAAEQLALKKGDAVRAGLAHAAAAALDQKVTKVRVVFPEGRSVTLTIDGAKVDETDTWLLATGYALEPNVAHEVVAEAPGMPRWSRRDVVGAPGVELPAMVVTDTRPAPAPAPAGPLVTPKARTAAYVVGGVGVAALGATVIFAILAANAKSDAKVACEQGSGFTYPDRCNQARQSDVDPANDRAHTDAAIATVTTVAGAVLLSTATVLFLVSSPRRATTSARLGVAPNGAGAAVVGAF